MRSFVYYHSKKVPEELFTLLEQIKTRHGIPFELVNLQENQEREKWTYETQFKPRAHILKKRTGKSLYRELRGSKSHRYYISVPGTLAVFEENRIKWYALLHEAIEFLREVLARGQVMLDEVCQSL